MTIFWDTHIPIDPRYPDAIDASVVYLSYVAWPHPTAKEQADRDRLMTVVPAAIYKATRDDVESKKGRWLPPALPRVKAENIAATVNKAIRRIQQQRLPAALMALSRLFERRELDLSCTGLPEDQQERLVESLRIEAGRLRDLVLTRKRREGIPRLFHDIGEDAWQDSRPALAMTMGLWSQMPLGSGTYDECLALKKMALDARWVAEATRYARAIALRLDQTSDRTLNPSALLVPRRRVVRIDAPLFTVDLDELRRLLDLRVVDASEPARIAPLPNGRKSE
jgi:hypothetical protein